jgi:hypothetical protein
VNSVATHANKITTGAAKVNALDKSLNESSKKIAYGNQTPKTNSDDGTYYTKNTPLSDG